MPFPLLKLAALALGQISKRVASAVKTKAKEDERFRNRLIKVGQSFQSIQVKASMWKHGWGTKTTAVKPLSEQAAIDLTTEIINDVVIVVCGLAVYMLFQHKSDDGPKEEELDTLKKLVYNQTIELERLSKKVEILDEKLSRSTMFSKTASRVVEDFNKCYTSKPKV
ncbi:hypothetical protein DPMN_099954 [Dreissena polymorpha]|uniref:OPA3-like protein n=1 Tax=Dreissena polymorpha TaxID=45954 RepID=A0A9D4LEV8_DREPO|nr:hypothetical protein DPMN_099954 [Dreissena polymorpha]